MKPAPGCLLPLPPLQQAEAEHLRPRLMGAVAGFHAAAVGLQVAGVAGMALHTSALAAVREEPLQVLH